MLVEIKGKHALFSRPELRAERYSYEVPTKTAIVGILRQIYWKPEITYIIKKIYVINKPIFENIMQNNQTEKINMSKIIKGKDIAIARIENSTPRTMHVLKNVHYIVEIDFELTSEKTATNNITKHVEIFKRRVQKGQYYNVPVLGVREFDCTINLTDKVPFSQNRGIKELGYMLYDFDYVQSKPVFKKLNMINGCIDFEKDYSDSQHGWLFQELVNYYDNYCNTLNLPQKGFSTEKITYELVIDKNGNFVEINALHKSDKGKILPVLMEVPEAVLGRTSGVKPNFLYDNSKYVFGFDVDNSKQKAFVDKIKDICPRGTIPEIDAVLDFFQNSVQTLVDEDFKSFLEINKKGIKELNGNIVFRIKGQKQYVHEIPEVKHAWIEYKKNIDPNAIKCTCMITGQIDVLANIHPLIKGVINSSPFAKLVSLEQNSTAFEVYGLKGSENFPFGETAVFKYSTMLNYFLSQPQHRVSVGNSTFVIWSDNNNTKLLSDLKQLICGFKDNTEENDINIPLGERFYILELTANASRLVVNRFETFTYGSNEMEKDLKRMLSQIRYIYKDTKLHIHWDFFDDYNKNLNRKEEEVNMIKEQSFLLGELLAVLEKAQSDAVPNVRTTKTLADNYIEIAGKYPAQTFAKLLSFSRHHLNKIDYGSSEQIENILEKLQQYDEPFPIRLTPNEQCKFHMGYYAKKKEYKEFFKELKEKNERKDLCDNE